jgi:outer membrane protein assembly factor BamB
MDNDGNIFAIIRNNNGGLVKINEEENSAIELATAAQGIVWISSPCVDLSTGIVALPSDNIRELFWTFDPKEGWAFRQRYMKFKESTIQKPVNAQKRVIASCVYDGHFYCHYVDGHIVKIHPKTYEAETIYLLPQGGCAGMAFNPLNPKMLYLVFYSDAGIYANSLCSMDVTDPEGTFQKLSGTTSGGHRDGELSISQFYQPLQIFFDPEGNLYIADSGNHCIRRLNTTTNMVETVVGVPGVRGWKDGGKDEALFSQPRGIAVSSDGTVYVGDHGNARIRKLAIE